MDDAPDAAGYRTGASERFRADENRRQTVTVEVTVWRRQASEAKPLQSIYKTVFVGS